MFLLTKHRGGGVYFKGKTKEGKSVEKQGRKAIGPAARNEYGCQLYRLIFITTARQAEACLFNLKLLNKGNRQQIYLFIYLFEEGKRMKKLLAIVISMAMIVAMMPVGVFAAEETVVPVKSIEEFKSALSDTTGQNINIRLEEDLVNVEDVIAIKNGKNITIDMNGKNISFSFKKHFTVENGTLEFKGNGTVSEAEPYFGPVILKGGSQQTETNHSNVIVGKNITLKGWSALFIDSNSGSNYGINATVNGNLKGLDDTSGSKGAGIYINGQIEATTGAVPNIKIGSTATIESGGDGIYAAGYAKWNIEGAKITGATGIEIRAGELTVSENTKITGTSVPTTVTPNGNGSTTEGAGIAIAQHTTGLPIDVKIISGDIKGFSALYESNPQKNSAENIAKVKIAVSGGNFTAINGGTNAIYSEDKNNFITGGTYSDLSALDYLGDGADVTVELAADKTLSNAITIPAEKTITLDLGGNKLSRNTNSVLDVYGNLLLKNGNVEMTGAENKTAIWLNQTAKVTLESDVTVAAKASTNDTSSFAVGLWSDCTNAELTVKGKISGENGITINGNIKADGNTLTIAEGAEIKVSDTGIYLAGNGETNISGADIEGKTGIEIRAGNLNVNSGKIVGGSGETTCIANAGGTTTENAGIAVVQHTTKLPINVTINGGTVLGNTAIYKNNIQNNDPETSGAINVVVKGGTFSTDPSAYVADGYVVRGSNPYVVEKYIPYTPSTPKDNVTNNTTDKNTTADLTPAVKDNKAETTVDAKTADKIVEKALENKSEEIIVDATGNNTVASSEVAIPEKAVKEIAEKTDASLVIKTDNGKVDLDKTALAAVAEQAGTTGTVRLVVETVKTDADICHVNLKLVTSNGAVKDFKGGNVKVTINLTKELAAKELVCVYIDDNGIYTLVDGVLNADGTYTFTTGHFSEYAVMAKAEADKKIAEQLDTMIKDVNLKVRTSKTAKKNIKAVVSGDVKAITDAGYTVKYKFYRSEKKASKYVAKATKAGKTYVNTAGKKGTKYYYKAKALVYDGDKLVGQTVLKQCKYGVRTWSK